VPVRIAHKFWMPVLTSMQSLSGTTPAERTNATAVSSAVQLTDAHAVEVLQDCCDCQHYLRLRVFEFWKEKRKTLQKPMLRRLQAPTPECDANPYLVFRQRAKPNKPLTRRRREAQEESLEKIDMILSNLEHVLTLTSMIKDREAQKRSLTVGASVL
jgi:enhancer of polycomb-like protein